MLARRRMAGLGSIPLRASRPSRLSSSGHPVKVWVYAYLEASA